MEAGQKRHFWILLRLLSSFGVCSNLGRSTSVSGWHPAACRVCQDVWWSQDSVTIRKVMKLQTDDANESNGYKSNEILSPFTSLGEDSDWCTFTSRSARRDIEKQCFLTAATSRLPEDPNMDWHFEHSLATMALWFDVICIWKACVRLKDCFSTTCQLRWGVR